MTARRKTRHLVGTLPLIAAAGLAMAALAPRAAADVAAVAAGVEKGFVKLDGKITATAGRDEMRTMRAALQPLKVLFGSCPEISSILQTNSKGEVINELDREGTPGKKFRSVSAQRWFGEVAGMKPYYGSLKTRSDGWNLFWCKPITKGSGGFGGALVLRIDLSGALKGLAEGLDESFAVVHDGRTLFSHSWEQSYESETQPLAIRGMEGLEVKARTNAPAAAAPVEAAPAAAPTEAAKGSDPAATGAADPVAPEVKSGSTRKVVTIVAFLAVIGLIGGAIGKFLHTLSRRRNEALMREIEGGEPVAPTPVSPQNPRGQTIQSDSAVYTYADQGSGIHQAPRSDDQYLEENATVIMPRAAVRRETGEPEVELHSSPAHAEGRSFAGTQGVDVEESVPAEPTYHSQVYEQPAVSGSDQAGYEQLHQHLYQKIRRELETQFHQEWNARAEQIRQEIYGQAHEAFSRSMRGISEGLGRQAEELSRLVGSEQARLETINGIAAELRRLGDSLQGQSGQA